MSFAILFVFILIMFISLGIAAVSRTASVFEDEDAFLFGGNSQELAITSSVGALLSVTVVFTLFAVGMIGYGFATLVATLIGMVTAYMFLGYAGRRLASRSSGRSRLMSSHLDDSRVRPMVNALIIVQYAISLVCEFAVFRMMLTGFETEFPLYSLVTTLIIGFLCASWVVIGGYAGVLRTDRFQLTIFGMACVVLLPYILGGQSAIVNVAMRVDAWAWPPVIATATWMTFTFATFVAFPDVWIRNFGTLERQDFGSRSFFAKGFALLIAALVPILALSCYAAAKLGSFDRVYDVQRSLDFFAALFREGPNFGPVHWLVAAAFLCVFITTVDTWLIGVVQHSAAMFRPTGRSSGVLIGIPFAFALGAAALSNVVSGEGIYILGLFVFPFLYMNVLLFCGQVWPAWRAAAGERAYLWSWLAGAGGTALQLASDWPNRMNNAPFIIWNAMLVEVAVYVAFASFGVPRHAYVELAKTVLGRFARKGERA